MAKVTRSNPQAFETLNARIKELQGKQAQAGWFKSAVYPNGTPVAYVAAIQELGSAPQGIPPRPFMRPAISKNKAAWLKIMERGAQAVLKGQMTIGDVMGLVSTRAADDVAKAIVAVTTPPLKRATILARLRKRKDKTLTPTIQKPLVDTGLMLASVSHVVEDAK